MKYTLTLLFLYNAEVTYALQLRHLSGKIESRYVTRKPRITFKKCRAALIHVTLFQDFTTSLPEYRKPEHLFSATLLT